MGGERKTGFSGYLESSKDLINGFFLTLPVFFFYEGGVLLLRLDERNAADLIIRRILQVVGLQSLTVFNAVLLLIFVAAGLVVIRRNISILSLFPLLIIESAIYAIALGPLVYFMVGKFIPLLMQEQAGFDSLIPGFIFSLGAGFYEELFFRLLMTGGLFLLLKRLLPIPGTAVAAISLVVSAAIFSLFHHIGLEGTIDPVCFLYRFLAGIFLSAIFIFRGFAAAVYTHALYDIFIHLRGV